MFACKNAKNEFNSLKNNEIKYAKTLQMEKDGENTKIHIINPESKKVYKYYVFKEKNATVPKGYIGLKCPIDRGIMLSATHIGMLSKIEGLSMIVGVSNSKYVYNEQLKQAIAEGRVKSMGDEGFISLESIIQTKAQIIVYSAFNSEFQDQDRLEKLGIICIPNFDWKETHPLGKAEWIKFFGVLVNQEDRAEKYFKQIERNYNELKTQAKKISKYPSVFSGNMMGGYWYTPGGSSYQAQFYHDAQINYKYSNTTEIGSIALGLEKVLKENKKTEYWLDPGESSIESILHKSPKLEHLDAVQKKNVYCYSHEINRYWELSAIEPDHILSDLLQIFHPDTFNRFPLYFYRKLN
jgi:iron complex transport system substrate-binding protein